MRYRFIGKGGSMSYKNGKIYWGKHVVENEKSCFFFPMSPFRQYVPYGSEQKFFENWEVV